MLRALLLLTAIIAAVDGTSAQELEGRLKQIHDTGIVRLAYRSDANPFSFVSQNGRPEGYTIDLREYDRKERVVKIGDPFNEESSTLD